jgi:hypothetical protein
MTLIDQGSCPDDERRTMHTAIAIKPDVMPAVPRDVAEPSIPRTTALHATPTWRLLEAHGRKVPDYLWAGITRYVEEGIKPGLALTSIFANDLKETVVWSDVQVLASLHPIVKFIYNRLPLECQGNSDAVRAWVSRGGLNGQAAR